MTIKPIHPFPARMAPEIALSTLSSLPVGSKILEPMTGSGTVLRMASEFKHFGIGFDTDPLAVLITKVWTTPVNVNELQLKAKEIISVVKNLSSCDYSLPWIMNDKETKEFVNFWFAEPQRNALHKLCCIINEIGGAEEDALKVAVSRLIITKNRGASLARDVSHSRPHRVRQVNNFNVLEEFQKSIDFMVKRFESQPAPGNIQVSIGDARNLKDVSSSSIDAVLTSPPYLNAVDYLRSHKLSLVWFGYRISELRQIRSANIGTERSSGFDANIELANHLTESMRRIERLQPRQRNMINRYVLDLFQMLKEVHRALRSNGRAVFVVGNSCLSGVFIRNTEAIKSAANLLGLTLLEERERELPPNRRYLPPPTKQAGSDFGKRMRTENVLTFSKR